MPEKNGFIFFRQFAFVSVFGSKTECNAGENPENPLRIKSGYGNLRLFSKQFRVFGKKSEKTQKNRNPFLKNPKNSTIKKTDCGFLKTQNGIRFFPSLKNGIRSGYEAQLWHSGLPLSRALFEKRNPESVFFPAIFRFF